jgi:hypothetical protein
MAASHYDLTLSLSDHFARWAGGIQLLLRAIRVFSREDEGEMLRVRGSIGAGRLVATYEMSKKNHRYGQVLVEVKNSGEAVYRGKLDGEAISGKVWLSGSMPEATAALVRDVERIVGRRSEEEEREDLLVREGRRGW